MSKKSLAEQLETITLQDEILDDEVWSVIKAFFNENGLVRHQLESYNDFVHNISHKIFDTIRIWTVQEGTQLYTIEFENLFFQSPRLVESDGEETFISPMECLHRNCSYMAEVYMDVTISPPGVPSTRYEKILLGTIPVMVRSDLCNLYPILNDSTELAKKNECVYDQGGYFVICSRNESGNLAQRRIICSPEKPACNKVFVFTHRKSPPRFEVYAEIKSSSQFSHTTTIVGTISKKIAVVLPWIESATIPLGVVFCGLGVTDPQEVLRYVLGEDRSSPEVLELLSIALEASYECSTTEAALYYIGKRGKKFVASRDVETAITLEDPFEEEDRGEEIALTKSARIKEEAISYAQHLLDYELFPHLGTTDSSGATREKKCYFLGYMVSKLLKVITGQRRPEDRDHYAAKRVTAVGQLLGQQFLGALRRLQSEITLATRKALATKNTVNVLSWIKPSILTNAMVGALANNKWGVRGGSSATKGISQAYEQFNHAAGLSNLRKMVIPMAAEGGKIIAPRDLHGSHWMVCCPAETPEGKKTGLVKNLALTGLITLGTDSEPVRRIILAGYFHKSGEGGAEALPTKSKGPDKLRRLRPHSAQGCKVLVDGDWLGNTKDTAHTQELVAYLRNLRRGNNLSKEVSIAYDDLSDEIRITTDPGRLCRPVLIVHNNQIALKASTIEELQKQHLTWTDLMNQRVVELLDKAEEDSLLIAHFPSDLDRTSAGGVWGGRSPPQFTHCELHPSLMFGVGGSIIPFPNRNQSPRNCYQASMSKQSIGMPFTNYRQMMTGTFNTMAYLQKPLVMTRSGSILQFDELPSGQNAMVCVIPRPINEEDSLEMNQSSVDRGFMVSYHWSCYYEELREDGDFFGLPPSDTVLMKGDSQWLDEDGLVAPGVRVRNGDLLIGKFGKNPVRDPKKPLVSHCVIYEHEWPAVVDRVQRGMTGDGYQYVRVMLVQKRIPVVGDKFSACHSQKGTVGILRHQIDLPYSVATGMTPDLIVNTLALPSRMTIGMLVELLVGKVVSAASVLHRVSIEHLHEAWGSSTSEGGTAKRRCSGSSADRPSSEGLGEAPPPQPRPWEQHYRHPDTHLGDATPFRQDDLDLLGPELAKLGFERSGEEMMINGTTGEMMKGLIFTGPVYYQRLKHMVIDKVHARARGPRTTISHQPTDGRGADGGLRVGVQERDCILGQGASRFVKDRMMEQSDEYRMWVCARCGLNVVVQEEANSIHLCNVCGSRDVAKIRIPYGAKLLAQELMGMNIVARILPQL